MKPGSILLEMLIASAISAFLGVILFTGLNQTSRSMTRVTDRADLYTRASLFNYQLTRDLAGALAYFEFPKAVEEKKQSEGQEQPKKSAEAEKKKEEPKLIEKPFYAEDKDGNLQMLTFITSDPLVIYGKQKVRMARVVYRLEVDPDNKQSYKLVRQESDNVDFKAFGKDAKNKISSQELIHGIKAIKIEYTVAVPKEVEKESSSAKATADGRKSPEIKNFKSWGKKEEQDKIKRYIPDYVTITLTLWDDFYQRDETFIFKMMIDAQEMKAEDLVKKKQTGKQGTQKQTQPQTQSQKVANKKQEKAAEDLVNALRNSINTLTKLTKLTVNGGGATK